MEEVVIGVVVLCVVWEEEEEEGDKKGENKVEMSNTGTDFECAKYFGEEGHTLFCRKRFYATSLAVFPLPIQLCKT